MTFEKLLFQKYGSRRYESCVILKIWNETTSWKFWRIFLTFVPPKKSRNLQFPHFWALKLFCAEKVIVKHSSSESMKCKIVSVFFQNFWIIHDSKKNKKRKKIVNTLFWTVTKINYRKKIVVNVRWKRWKKFSKNFRIF